MQSILASTSVALFEASLRQDDVSSREMDHDVQVLRLCFSLLESSACFLKQTS